jgi:tetratricopeptide (TPR) repeat protein
MIAEAITFNAPPSDDLDDLMSAFASVRIHKDGRARNRRDGADRRYKPITKPLKKKLRHSPAPDPDALRMLGIAYYATRKYAKAVHCLSQALEAPDRFTPVTLRYRARANWELGERHSGAERQAAFDAALADDDAAQHWDPEGLVWRAWEQEHDPEDEQEFEEYAPDDEHKYEP